LPDACHASARNLIIGVANVLSLITGVGSKGQVGEAVAAAMAGRGDVVLLVSRVEEEVRARADELIRAGHRSQGYECDLSKHEVVDRLAQRVREDHGDRLDALVNLAGGFASSGPLAQSDPSTFARMLEINLTTAYLTTRALLPLIRAANGSIVFFASDIVLESSQPKNVAGYVAAKSGVVALMRSVAEEGRDYGVRANALAPSAIRTATNEASMGAEARYVEREDVASAVLFLCSPASRAITGQVIRLRK
jgi:NAD(P)-dependent dehydrogenase (short-subunit alcohol dehydrogenase family)